MKKLTLYIEDRMLNHIKDKIPEMRDKLEKQLRIVSKSLEDIGRKESNPLEIALRDYENIVSYLHELHTSSFPNFRSTTDEMSHDIFNIEMEPLGLIDFNATTASLKRNRAGTNITLTSRHYKMNALALEDTKFSEDCRGLINIPFIGKEKELEKWINQFLVPCEEFLRQYIDDVFKSFREDIVHTCIEEGSSDSTKQLIKTFEIDVLGKVISQGREDALDFVEKLVESVKQNMYTTNTHYLNECSTSLKDDSGGLMAVVNTSYKADIRPHYNNVCDILAFLKTRKKLLPDTVQLHITQCREVLSRECKAKLQQFMMDSQTLEVIKEPQSVATKRKLYLEREKQIKGALNEISRF
mmetsp:Transcript_11417/g.14312  ORF Transcript_11417/g.14312 Transcript_11417/m.14312 type:complete len:355 (-) Transcript_11417:717-1781(-)